MFQDSAEDVTNLCMSLQEAKHRSRSRKGFHVFLSRYFHDFTMLTYEQQLAEVQQLSGPSNASDNDASVPCKNTQQEYHATRMQAMEVLT